MKGRIAGAAAAAALLAWPSAAFAHHCFVAKKPTTAGSAGTVVLDVVTEETISEDVETTKNGRLKGAFITLTAVAGGTELGTWDVFEHRTLPEGAMNSGPGDDACDGIGVDDAIACAEG
jgi:hypothetical protein